MKTERVHLVSLISCLTSMSVCLAQGTALQLYIKPYFTLLKPMTWNLKSKCSGSTSSHPAVSCLSLLLGEPVAPQGGADWLAIGFHLRSCHLSSNQPH